MKSRSRSYEDHQVSVGHSVLYPRQSGHRDLRLVVNIELGQARVGQWSGQPWLLVFTSTQVSINMLQSSSDVFIWAVSPSVDHGALVLKHQQRLNYSIKQLSSWCRHKYWDCQYNKNKKVFIIKPVIVVESFELELSNISKSLAIKWNVFLENKIQTPTHSVMSKAKIQQIPILIYCCVQCCKFHRLLPQNESQIDASAVRSAAGAT